MNSIWSCVLRATLAVWLALAATAALAQAPAAPDDAVVFDILEFEIDGNSVLPIEAIEKAVMPFLGERKKLADAEAARVALEKAYQGAGYLTVFVDLPEQRIDQGVVKLAVAEGRVERLKVSGSRYFSQGYIRSKVPELSDGKVPNFNEVQRQLAAVNRTEDRRVQPIMRAGRDPGTVETELKVEDRLPASATLELNNRHAPDTTPWRLNVSGRYDNLFQRDHSISFSAATAPEATRESRVLSLNYMIPNDDQSAWVVYAVNSNSNVEALGAIDVVGKGTTLGLRFVKPLLTTADQSHSATLGVDYKDLKEETRTGADVISTPLRYLPFSVGYNGSVDHGAQRSTLLNLQMLAAFRQVLRREVDCIGVNADQFACKRQGGDGGFATVRGDVRHALPLGPGQLKARLGGQVATGPVPSGEQYTIGGAETVRGYLEAEGAGDRAVLGSLEWRSRDLTTSLSGTVGDADAWPLRVAGLGFVDVARAYVFEPATGQAPWTSLAGAGVGMRLNLRKSMSGEFDLAWPLKATAATAARSPRLHVRLAVEL